MTGGDLEATDEFRVSRVARPVADTIVARMCRLDAVKKTWLIDPELVRQAQRISGA